ncbi:Ubiquitin-conjugating enzyme E2 6 [Yarrowia sp. B02]|nr:Ubiquitin-conjugating enzyme E2 6 [Yarrowia sp. B02]
MSDKIPTASGSFPSGVVPSDPVPDLKEKKETTQGSFPAGATKDKHPPMATKAANKRLVKEYASIQENAPPFITAKPAENNLLEWHYLITGPPNTPYEGGQYHGVLLFPSEYPFKPPGIKMITPSGRFVPNTRLCLSISDYHPDTWNPAWTVSTILTGLLSFMTSDEHTAGSMTSTDATKRTYASESRRWNLNEKSFLTHFGGTSEAVPEPFPVPRRIPVVETETAPSGSPMAKSKVVNKKKPQTNKPVWSLQQKLLVVLAVILAWIVAARFLGKTAN